MSAREIRQGALGPTLLFAAAAVLAVAALMWLRHGDAVFRDLILTGLPLCL